MVDRFREMLWELMKANPNLRWLYLTTYPNGEWVAYERVQDRFNWMIHVDCCAPTKRPGTGGYDYAPVDVITGMWHGPATAGIPSDLTGYGAPGAYVTHAPCDPAPTDGCAGTPNATVTGVTATRDGTAVTAQGTADLPAGTEIAVDAVEVSAHGERRAHFRRADCTGQNCSGWITTLR
eukprot:gene46587-41011_t